MNIYVYNATMSFFAHNIIALSSFFATIKNSRGTEVNAYYLMEIYTME